MPKSVDSSIHIYHWGKVLYCLPCFSHTGNGMKHKWTIIIGVLSAATLFSMCTLAIIVLGRSRSRKYIEEDPKAVLKSSAAHKSYSWQKQYLQKEGLEGQIYLIQVRVKNIRLYICMFSTNLSIAA